MIADIKAPRNADSRERVRKLTLTAQDDADELKLSLIAYALYPIGGKRDKRFDSWLITRMSAYLKRKGLTIVKKEPTK